MGFFRKDSTTTTQELRGRRDAAQARLERAKAAHESAVTARRDVIASDYEEGDLVVVDQRLAEAQRAVAGATDAIFFIDEQIAEAVRQASAAEEDRRRKQEVERVNILIATAEEALSAFGEACDNLIAAFRPLGVGGEMVAHSTIGIKSQALVAASEPLQSAKIYRADIALGARPLPSLPPREREAAAA